MVLLIADRDLEVIAARRRSGASSAVVAAPLVGLRGALRRRRGCYTTPLLRIFLPEGRFSSAARAGPADEQDCDGTVFRLVTDFSYLRRTRAECWGE